MERIPTLIDLVRKWPLALPPPEAAMPTEQTVIELPALVERSGPAGRFAYEEFFYGKIRNVHTRAAYRHAVHRFLAWCEPLGLELHRVTPRHVGDYLDQFAVAVVTTKLHLSALRHFFDELVRRHVIVLNPAASVRTERLQVVEGKTPEITVEQARRLLESIDLTHVVGLRDRAIIATLIYTAARVGAVAKLGMRDLYFTAEQYCLRFQEKNGKSREIPVRHDLQQMLFQYTTAAGLDLAAKDAPLFRTAMRRTKRLTDRPMRPADICCMMKRRLKDADLPMRLSPHSIRVATITDLLLNGISLHEVQYLAGHSDPRTTQLYDRRQRRVTRNIVERISI